MTGVRTIGQHWYDGLQRNEHGKLQCSLCPRSFKRPEHLKRHERGHEDFRRFSCPICHKGFARSDILSRHTAIHSIPPPPPPESQEGRDARRLRACKECARARERCSKGSPCLRCSARSIYCVYPDTGNGQQQASGSQQEASAGADISMSDMTDFQSASTAQDSGLGGSSVVPPAENFPVSHDDAASPFTARSVRASTRNGNHESSAQPELQGPGQQPEYQDATLGLSQEIQAQPSAQLYSAQPFGYPASDYNPDLDFPLNWLPSNNSLDIDYGSFLGLAMSPSNPQSTGLPFPLNVIDDTSRPRGPTLPPGATPRSHSVSSLSKTTATTPSMAIDPALSAPNNGMLYATSTNGARVPCTVRSRRRGPPPQLQNHHALLSIADDPLLSGYHEDFLAFPDLHHLTLESPTSKYPNRTIQPQTYDTIQDKFREICLGSSTLQNHFATPDFPSKEELGFAVELYFEHFAPLIPLVHEQCSNINDEWLLTLAIAAIGCQYAQTQEYWASVIPMHEFLRRALLIETENRPDPFAQLHFMQAFVLSQIGMSYCGSSRLQMHAKARHGKLVDLIKSQGLLKSSDAVVRGLDSEMGMLSQQQKWLLWVEQESRRRLGYSIWLLDCMGGYHFAGEPALSLGIAQADLPNDGLWTASGYREWANVYQKSERNPSLSSATQALFRDKQVKSDIGEFSRVILLHGIYREIFQVRSFAKRPLASWVPSAQPPFANFPEDHMRQGILSDNGTSYDRDRTDMTLFTSWRNAALDCVDTLHWAANATIAMLSGSEHPTVMHLHFSRTILLAPYNEILTLASSVLPPKMQVRRQGQIPTRQEAIQAEHEVLQWAQRDESKARLTALHCGCFYWHIRRYSTMAFYEPVSVFLATLTLWAYSYYTSRATARRQPVPPNNHEGRSGSASREGSPQQQEDRSIGPSIPPQHMSAAPSPAASRLTQMSSMTTTFTADPDPTFIRLDRPNDDEMVQLFVRSGRPSNMRAYITGVGDICGPEAPMRILREGRKILTRVSVAWGRTREYYDVLEALEQATANRGNDGRAGDQQ